MDIRNVAIIAHVDHGKTTLVDALLKQSADFTLRKDQADALIMDSNELERERGITIFSKNAAVRYQDTKINIVDTPGHADFGGEVERIMRMVDGCLLVIDAQEGPMPQTRFVLKHAIRAGHRIIVVINKIDKPAARPDWALNQTFDLFVELGASDAQADFPVVYASGVQGKAGYASDISAMTSIEPVFMTIVKEIPAPVADASAPAQFLTVNVARDNFKGKLAIGRLYRGVLRSGMSVVHIARDGSPRTTRITAVMAFDGLQRVETESAVAGDIVAVAGIPEISIGDTIADPADPTPLPTIAIEEPTVEMTFGVNTSPFSGREGPYATSRNLEERLAKELETDVALRVTPLGEGTWTVAGRGELHLAILIEKMRREGYELQVSRPKVICKRDGDTLLEPIEHVTIESPDAYAGAVIEELGKRRGEMLDMRSEHGTATLEFRIPTRGLIGFRNTFLTKTKGLGIMHSILEGYGPHRGEFNASAHGSLIAFEAGITSGYGLANAQERGQLFVGSGVTIYEGMVVGENAKPEDIEVNVCKEKKLSNMRSKGEGEAIRLDVAHTMDLEDAIEYIGDDELVEVTPQSVRIRKAMLSSIARKRNDRRERSAMEHVQ
ncbi:translational GTPase TypA [Candidatus Uhrbacteria bacterium]|nr:translational GTPase TypA [Candidatus Uhrbacteria bacterium]